MMGPKTVDTIYFEIEVDILEWETAGGTQYEWEANTGDESVELFETVEEAMADARRHFG